MHGHMNVKIRGNTLPLPAEVRSLKSKQNITPKRLCPPMTLTRSTPRAEFGKEVQLRYMTATVESNHNWLFSEFWNNFWMCT